MRRTCAAMQTERVKLERRLIDTRKRGSCLKRNKQGSCVRSIGTRLLLANVRDGMEEEEEVVEMEVEMEVDVACMFGTSTALKLLKGCQLPAHH
jgi:hypothetical protein